MDGKGEKEMDKSKTETAEASQDTTDNMEGTDTTDAKTFGKSGFSKMLCGISRAAMNKITLEDIEDAEIEDSQVQNYKRMPTIMTRKEMLADVYKMDFPRRGKAVIINNKNFSPDLARMGFGTRSGTDLDATKIGSRLKLLGFDVERRHDITSEEILSVFKKIANEDHSDADCFVGVLLSHGEKDKIYGTDDCVELKDIFEFFKGNNCKTLAGKPKIFFIQACRGSQLDAGVEMNVTDAKREFDEAFPDVPTSEIRIPNEADFLISYSTVPGYYSWRNSRNGSWFMQALVQVLDECGTTSEILRLLTRVNRVVAYDQRFQSNTLPKDPDMHGMKQVPSFTSMLTKDLYFIPKTT